MPPLSQSWCCHLNSQCWFLPLRVFLTHQCKTIPAWDLLGSHEHQGDNGTAQLEKESIWKCSFCVNQKEQGLLLTCSKRWVCRAACGVVIQINISALWKSSISCQQSLRKMMSLMTDKVCPPLVCVPEWLLVFLNRCKLDFVTIDGVLQVW